MGTPESKVKAKLKQLLRDKGRYWFMPVQTGYGSTTLDFLVCSDDGHFVAYECKADGRELTPRQELVARQITNAGGDVYKVTLVNGELVFTLCGLTGSAGS